MRDEIRYQKMGWEEAKNENNSRQKYKFFFKKRNQTDFCFIYIHKLRINQALKFYDKFFAFFLKYSREYLVVFVNFALKNIRDTYI